MPLTAGTRLGPYEISAPLGAGGMGEVYRARDTRLGRDVAVKVLPHHLSANPEVRARFEREAKTVSGLNHPNICVLFDVGRQDDTDFLVMELIEGDTLADRLKRGPLPAAELLRLATQVADALDRAHRAGVVHRDLKPGNIMITRNGAKLMDFGLSRVTGIAGTNSGSGQASAGLTQSPTVAQALTAEGTLLGTFQYMAPEQLEGREADTRSDIWALGCVLYEMATGRRAFEGRSQASLIAAILERDPSTIGEAPSGTATSGFGGPPAGLERLIRNCLAKDPDERIQTAHDARLHLQAIAEGAGLSSTSVASGSISQAAVARARAGGSTLPWLAAAVGVLAAIGVSAWAWTRLNAPEPSLRFQVSGLSGVQDLFWPRISPDGRYLVFMGVDSTGASRAYMRRMDQTEILPIPGTEGLTRPYWSPDGKEVGFVAEGQLKRVPVGGGSPVVIGAAEGGADLSWGSKGTLLLDGSQSDSLRKVPAGGGQLRPASRIDRAAGEIGSAWPCFLPDGEHFLFIGSLPSGTRGNIRLGRLGSLDSKLLGESDGRVECAPGGWVLFVRGTTLLAQKLDLGAGKLTGEPITLANDLRIGSSQGHFSASETGMLAFARLNGAGMRMLRAGDRAGNPVGDVLATGVLSNPRPSADGSRLLYQREGGTGARDGEAYVLDLQRGTDTRLTFTEDRTTTPVWSPDGERFAYVTRADSSRTTLHLASVDGLGTPDSIALPGREGASLFQWAGDRLVYNAPDLSSSSQVPVAGSDRAPRPLISGGEPMVQAQVSPDGRWLAGVVGRSATTVQIYVQSLQGPAGRWQISVRRGFMPRWTKGGRELLFETFEGQVMGVDIDVSSGFRAGTPRALFRLPSSSFGPERSSWGCDEQGERFWLISGNRGNQSGNIEVVTRFQNLVSRK